MRIWQDTLPLASWPDFGLTPIDQVLRTDMESGDPKARRLSVAVRDMADVSWKMPDAQFGTFKAWWGDLPWSLTGESDDISSSWVRNASSTLTNVDLGPDGQGCDRIVEDSTTDIHAVTLTLGAMADGAVLVARATLKAQGRANARLILVGKDGVGRFTGIDLSGGTLAPIATSGLISRTIKDRGNGWYRVEITASVGTGASLPYLRISGADGTFGTTYAGDGTSGISVCEQQARIMTGADLHLPTDANGYATGAAGGSAWFSMPIAVGGGVALRQCRFIGPYAAKPLQGLNWRVMGKVMVR